MTKWRAHGKEKSLESAVILPDVADVKPVIGIGAATWDHFYKVSEFPCGEGVAQATASVFQGGGPVATALCVMAQQGLPALLIDAQGDDAIGGYIRSDLQQRGIQLGQLRVQPGATSPHAVVLVRERDAARHITYFPSNAPMLKLDAMDEGIIAGAALLHLNGRHEEAAQQAVVLARQHGVPVSFDGGAGRYRDSIRPLVLASDILIVAREFAERCTGRSMVEEMSAALLQTASLVVITDGTQGSHVRSRAGESCHQPPFPAAPMIDTTGCGDVYHGAFLAAWLQRKTLRECAVAASRLAALNAQGLGGRYALGCSG